MKYAVVQFAGKQFKIHEGDILTVERQNGLNFNVLAYSTDNHLYLGTPFLPDVKINASLLENKLDKKIKVVRFKAKSRYKKANGHRQPISVVKIDQIVKEGEVADKAQKKPEMKKTKKVSKIKIPKVKVIKKPIAKTKKPIKEKK